MIWASREIIPQSAEGVGHMELANYALVIPTLILGVFIAYINWMIYKISKDIYRVSEALLEVNVSIYQVTTELLEASKKLEEKF